MGTKRGAYIKLSYELMEQFLNLKDNIHIYNVSQDDNDRMSQVFKIYLVGSNESLPIFHEGGNPLLINIIDIQKNKGRNNIINEQ